MVKIWFELDKAREGLLLYKYWIIETYAADMDSEEIPDDINIHKKIWGKNADEVVYGGTEARKKGEGKTDNTEINSRIDEFGYCACDSSSG